jgi:flagellar hook-length control protein FliK
MTTTDRTTATRAPRHERPAPRTPSQSPAADAFAELLGAQAPAQPQRPERREPQRGRDERDAKPEFEASVDARQGAAPAQPAVNGQTAADKRPAQPGASTGPAQPGTQATPGIKGPVGQPGTPGQPAATGAVGTPAQPGAANALGAAQAPAEAAEGAAQAGAESAESQPVPAEIKLPKVPAMPVPAPPQGKAATPAGWLGPQAAELKPAPSVAPAPAAAPVAAPPNGEAATPSGWRGPETTAPAAQTAPAASVPIQATTTAAPAPTPASPPASTTPLAHAPAAVDALLQLAHERGISRARINLRPVELGGIEVRLHSTAAGITAHLVADSPEAAKLLSQAGDELRRNLEQRDVNLLSLEVSTTADDRRDAPKGQTARDADLFRTSVAPRGDRAEAEEPAPVQTPIRLELPGGLLVDVLA